MSTPSRPSRRASEAPDLKSPQFSIHSETQKRLVRFRRSRHRLHTHPAIANAPLPPSNHSHDQRYSASDDAPLLLHELYNNLVQRELGTNPDDHSTIEKKLSDMQEVAPRPSLSDPLFIQHISSSSKLLSDKRLLSRVSPNPLDPPHVPSSASAVHRFLSEQKKRREAAQREEKSSTLQENPCSSSSPTPLVTRKRPRPPETTAYQLEEQSHAKEDALPAARKTRSSAKSSSPQKISDGVDPSRVPAEASPSTRENDVKTLKSSPGANEMDYLSLNKLTEKEGIDTLANPISLSPRRTRSSMTKAGRSSSRRSECCFCPDPTTFGEELSSELIGPFLNPKATNSTGLFVHFECACWAPQVYADPANGQLRRVYDEYCRGRQLRCSHCQSRGATIGCYVNRCKRVFHYRCLGPAGAFRVDRFFVAFCERHAHLGSKKSYQILMEAATIADVAAAHRKDDSTFGLDAPHSRFTMLRRRETEIIFSRKWGTCSHTGALEHGKVLFSRRRRLVLNKNERFRVGDGLQVLRCSAISIASGRLAHMAVIGTDKVGESMSDVEARAAIASRDSTGLFLLRNLRKAPEWGKEEITITRRKTGHIEPKHSTGKPGGKFAKGASGKADEEEFRVSTESTPGVNGADDSGTFLQANGEGESKIINSSLKSIRLPSFKRVATSVTPSCAPSNTPLHTGLQSSQPSLPFPNTGTSARGAAAEFKGRDTREGLNGKVKSAWEVFLDEQLPKERILRPDDSLGDAMRNMARLWTSMTVEQRERYEKKANASANLSTNGNISSSLREYAHRSNVPTGSISSNRGNSTPASTNLGFFAANPRSLREDVYNPSKRPAEGNQPTSLSLPGRRDSVRLATPKRTGSATLGPEPNWDELFPASLSPAKEHPERDPSSEDTHVKQAPPLLSKRRKS